MYLIYFNKKFNIFCLSQGNNCQTRFLCYTVATANEFKELVMIKNKYKISYNNLFTLNPKRCRNYFLIQAGEALCLFGFLRQDENAGQYPYQLYNASLPSDNQPQISYGKLASFVRKHFARASQRRYVFHSNDCDFA